jgi:hypothetical protein
MLTKEKVIEAINQWPCLYETREGRKIIGETVSGMPGKLRECGWKKVSSMGEYEFKKLGLEIVEARYIGGAHPKKFCSVIVAREAK